MMTAIAAHVPVSLHASQLGSADSQASEALGKPLDDPAKLGVPENDITFAQAHTDVAAGLWCSRLEGCFVATLAALSDFGSSASSRPIDTCR